MTLNHMGAFFDFDLPALLAQEGSLILVLGEKQAHLIAGAALGGAGRTDGELNHPAGLIPKTLYGENVMSFQLSG